MKFLEWENSPLIKSNFVLSLGPACRPAQMLKEAGLRYFSSPLDWMMSYSLSYAARYLLGQETSFFKEWEYIRDTEKHHVVKDKKSGMVSMHAFPIEQGIEEYLPEFKSIMERRLGNVRSVMAKSDKLVFLSNRKCEEEKIENFATVFAEAFHREIFYININDLNDGGSLEPYFVDKRIGKCEIINFYFDDTHKNGREKTNPSWWKGNEEKWKFILSKVQINKTGLTKIKFLF